MITIKKELSVAVPYPLEQFGALEELLFFDIETTGFSGDYSSLYLIGAVYYEGGRWKLIQWFADRADAEEELLHAFFAFLKRFRCLIHFNGDSFDIPYLLKRCAAYQLDYSFHSVRSLDIYRIIKPHKKIMGLESLKLKSIEHFLGILRDDTYTGGQLIEVYQEYLDSQSEYLYRLLLLHNEDDLKGMPAILPILCYHDFLNGPFVPIGQTVRQVPDYTGKMDHFLLLSYESPVCLPVPLEVTIGCFEMELSKRRLTLSVPLYEGELKHFYRDYRNYYYLIYEDTAIHKSVGQYVEKAAKQKATAKTCYTRVQGVFLPQPAPIWDDCLKIDYKDKQSYVLYSSERFDEPGLAVRYLKEVLSEQR